jgi:hypothetical protein
MGFWFSIGASVWARRSLISDINNIAFAQA